jgi:hypothetical protein
VTDKPLAVVMTTLPVVLVPVGSVIFVIMPTTT